MKYQAENAVSSFFYYMWNAWSKEECKAVFGDMYRHFWDKWSALADKSIFGAAERFFAELSENNQKLLVERAVTLYDGRAFRKEPDDSDILVCKECGSRQLEIQAWINANTDERIRYVHDDNNGLWCDGKRSGEDGAKNVAFRSFSVLRRSSHKRCRAGGSRADLKQRNKSQG